MSPYRVPGRFLSPELRAPRRLFRRPLRCIVQEALFTELNREATLYVVWALLVILFTAGVSPPP